MITAAVKQRWVANLRSGKYRQCRGVHVARGGTMFCALGLLAHGEGQVNKGQDGEWLVDFPSVLRDLPVKDSYHVIRMNDERRKDFATIADWVEANLEVGDEGSTAATTVFGGVRDDTDSGPVAGCGD